MAWGRVLRILAEIWAICGDWRPQMYMNLSIQIDNFADNF
jgi:hypothetical protein